VPSGISAITATLLGKYEYHTVFPIFILQRRYPLTKLSLLPLLLV
jgi:hypothetical protein